MFRVAADLLVILHLAFVGFVVLGGLLVAGWPRLAWAHVPAAAWGIIIEYLGWVCPLTPLENDLRQRGGGSAYDGDFVEHYILPVLYPSGLTARTQIWLGSIALVINVLIYWRVLRGRARAAG